MLSLTRFEVSGLGGSFGKVSEEIGCWKLGLGIGVCGGVSALSKLNTRSGRVGPGPGVGGRGQGGPPASDSMAMGVVKRLG